MPLDPKKIQTAIAAGTSVVCASCPRYWEGIDLKSDRCTAPGPCGGPLSGLAYPHYSGPVSNFEGFCFVCGNNSEYGVTTDSSPRIIGVCGRHIQMLINIVPKGKELVGVGNRHIRTKDETITEEDLIPVKKKTLFQAIQEAEDYFDEQASKGKKG